MYLGGSGSNANANSFALNIGGGGFGGGPLGGGGLSSSQSQAQVWISNDRNLHAKPLKINDERNSFKLLRAIEPHWWLQRRRRRKWAFQGFCSLLFFVINQ